LTRIICGIEGTLSKSPEERDVVALSPHAQPLYSTETDFARATDLTAKNPKMIVIDSSDIEADKLGTLMDEALKNNTVVIFLDNDAVHQNIAKVYQLLNQKQEYRKNTVIVMDLCRRFDLPEFNLGVFVTFNKAIADAYAAGVGGSIAAVSTLTQIGTAVELVTAQLERVPPAKVGNKITSLEDKNVINETYMNMEPDPTLAITPTRMLDKYGPAFFLSSDFPVFLETLMRVTDETGLAQEFPGGIVRFILADKDISKYDAAFNKAESLGIVKELNAAESRYVKALVAQPITDREAFLNKLLNEPNPEIVDILKKAHQGKQLTAEEIVRMWMVFNIKKMHVGAPVGMPRDDKGTAAIKLPEERLTPAQLVELRKKADEADAFFARTVFGLDFTAEENVAGGYYGSKVVTQDHLRALYRIFYQDSGTRDRKVQIIRMRPDYVGNGSTIKGIGTPDEDVFFCDTDSSKGWLPRAVHIAKVMDKMAPKAKKVIRSTSPENPTGVVIPQEIFEEDLELAVRRDAVIEMDIAYARLIRKGKLPANLGEVCRNIFQRLDPALRAERGINTPLDVSKHLILIKTQSKEILQPGLRYGAAMSGDTRLIQMMRKIQIFKADPVATKAEAEIYGPEGAAYSRDFIERHNAVLESNISYLYATLTRLGITCDVEPQGAFYLMLRIGKGPAIRFAFPGAFSDIVLVAARIERLYSKWKEREAVTFEDMFREAGVTSVPGEAFHVAATLAEQKAINARLAAELASSPLIRDDLRQASELLMSLKGSGMDSGQTSPTDEGGFRYATKEAEYSIQVKVLPSEGGPISDLPEDKAIMFSEDDRSVPGKVALTINVGLDTTGSELLEWFLKQGIANKSFSGSLESVRQMLQQMQTAQAETAASSPLSADDQQAAQELIANIAELMSQLRSQAASGSLIISADGVNIQYSAFLPGTVSGGLDRSIKEAADRLRQLLVKNNALVAGISIPLTYLTATNIENLNQLVAQTEVEVASSSPVLNKDLGGIDFRAIPMLTQPMGNLSGIIPSLPQLSSSPAQNIDLQAELGQIQKMLAAGITPSGERLKEFVAACYQRGELKQWLDGIVMCLAELCKLEEANVEETPKEVKELLLIVDSVI
jgi:aspartate/methionine/tyrosine aminotransferase